MFGLNLKGKCWFWGSLVVVLLVAIACITSGCSLFGSVKKSGQTLKAVGTAADRAAAKRYTKEVKKVEKKALKTIEEIEGEEEEDEL